MKYFLTRWHALAFITAFLICILGVWWEWQGAPVRTGGTWLVLKVIPLVLCLKGLWHARLYYLQIVSILILLYMCEGVIRGMGDKNPSHYYAWAQFCLSWACFMGCLGHVRPYKQAYKTHKQIK